MGLVPLTGWIFLRISIEMPSARTASVGSGRRESKACSMSDPPGGTATVCSEDFVPQNEVSNNILCGDGERDIPEAPLAFDALLP